MYTFDLVLFCLSVALYTAYNLYIRHKESVDPGFTIHGISRTHCCPAKHPILIG